MTLVLISCVCTFPLPVDFGLAGRYQPISTAPQYRSHYAARLRDEADRGQPSRNDNRTERRGLSRFKSTSTTLCQVPSSGSPASTGTLIDGAMIAGITWSAP